MVLLTAVLFVGLLLTLVLVHEWGHFIVAKKAGCKVEEFGFGFPPRLWSFMWHGTLYSFNLFPIGGFVKIEGENMDEAAPSKTSFAAKSAGKRIGILAAGVVMNMVLAWLLLSIQSGIGSPTIVTGEDQHLSQIHTYIADVAPASPAQQAGLAPYDRIVSVNSLTNPTVQQIQQTTKENLGKTVRLEIERAGIHTVKDVPTRENPPEGEGALGISLAATGLSKTVWWKAPWAGLKRTGEMTYAILIGFGTIIGQLVSGQSVGGSVTGPIGIAVYTGEVARMGLAYFLEFAAMISINLALVNILPFPALDGGRIVFVALESILRRRLPSRIEGWAHAAGFALLIGLMILITLKDVRHYFY